MLFALWFIYWMMILLSEMMRLFDAILIVPLYETFIIFNMILLDAVYFGREETKEEAASRKMYFWCGILICIIGMFVLTYAQKDNVNSRDIDDIEVDTIHYHSDGKFLFEKELHDHDDAEDQPLIAKLKHTMDYNSLGKQQYDLV